MRSRGLLWVALLAVLWAPSPLQARQGGGALAPYQDVRPYSALERSMLARTSKDVGLFRRGAQIFNHTIRHLIERAYLNEKYQLDRRYRKNLEEASRSAQSRRIEAIKEYEAFVKRYPDDKVWTPDVLMRLAELYYEKAEVDFRYADKRYQKRLIEIERLSRLAKRELPVPSRPVKDYGAALEYYRELLTKFPRYKKRDMVIYVLGYVLRLAGQEVEASDDPKLNKLARRYHAMARQAFLGLVCANKYNPLAKPQPVTAPTGYNISIVKPATDPGVDNPFNGFDPYAGCKPALDLSRLQGDELKKRRFLLSQTWFLVGEEHFDADPEVALDAEEKAKISADYQRYRGPSREEVFRNRWREMGNDKKLRVLRLHNYYAISAYTRVAKEFKDSKEYNSALYKRAWTYFKIDRYRKALQEFDDLLVRAKEKDLQENAVRYVALCAYYQRESKDPFGWLKAYYQKKGWLNAQGGHSYSHVKAAFQQLADVLWEEAQPPPDDPGAENYDAENLEKALTIYRWLLAKGGFSGDDKDPGNADRDWMYFKGKAQVQVQVLRILGMLMVNVDKKVRSRYPRRLLYEERKRAFDRFAIFRGSPHLKFAKEYDHRWSSDKAVAEALQVLRENSMMAMGRDFFNLGGQYYNAAQKAVAELKGLMAQKAALEAAVQAHGRGWYRKRRKLQGVLGRIDTVQESVKKYKATYQGYFAQAARAFQVIINHPQYKDTLTAYKAMFYMGQALYYSGKYLEAARVFKAVQYSKISMRHAKEAISWRITSFSEVVSKIKLPPDPDPKKDKTVDRKPIPPLLKEYHELLKEMIAADPKSKDVPAYKYLIAAHYYRYRQFPEARPLMMEIYQKYCGSRQAFYAGQHLMTMVSIEHKPDYLERLERLAKMIKKKQCGEKVTCKAGDPDCDAFAKLVKEKREEIKKLGPKILEYRAFKAYNAKRYEQAAILFSAIIKRFPDSKRIALFLYNAAYSFERIKRFGSAKKMYELIYTKYRAQAAKTKIKDKSGKVIDDGILDNVVEFLAQVAIKALDYDASLKYFGVLATDPSFAKHPGRVAWYYRYAQLLKAFGRYDEAVKFFREKYVREVQSQLPRWRRLARTTRDPKKKKTYEGFIRDAKTFVPSAELEIGQIRERQKRWRLMITAYLRYVSEIEREFDRKRGQIGDPSYWAGHVKEYGKARQMMRLLQKVLSRRRAMRAGGRTIREMEDRIVSDFERYKLPPRTQAATAAAAIVFARIKDALARFKKVKMTYKRIRVRWRWNKRNALKHRSEVIQKARDAVMEAIKKLTEEVQRYTKIYLEKRDRYADNVWFVAFQAHIGKIYEMAADQVADPKWPKLAKKWVDTFKKQFEDPFEFVEKIKGLVFGTPNLMEKANETWTNLAKKFYRSALAHAAKVGIANEWTDRVRQWLARIDPSSPYIHPAKVEPLR